MQQNKENQNPGFSLKSANDSNYKQIVLDHYDSTREVILSATMSRMDKYKVIAAYHSTKLVTGLVLPYVSNSVDNSLSLKDSIIEDLESLDNIVTVNMGIDKRKEVIDLCTKILNNLTPLFTYIGLYVRRTRTGEFKFPDKDE